MNLNKNITNHYILSRNRSGSTLLNNLLNNHPNILSISELNIYWLLKCDYENVNQFDTITIKKLIDDLFFVLGKKRDGFYMFMLPSKVELIETILNHKNPLDFLIICRIINSKIKATFNEKKQITTLVNKEISLNHLIDKIHHHSPKTKFVLLVRNHRANIYSSLKFNSARKNYIYEAKRWTLDLKPLIKSNIPQDLKLIIKYEDLILDTGSCLEKIQLFLGVKIIENLSSNPLAITTELLDELAKKNNVPEKEIKLFKKHHFNSFLEVDKEKINEWENQSAFNKIQLNKIDSICQEVATSLGYPCLNKKVSFSLIDKYFIILAIIDNYVATRYITMPIRYKRILAKINFFKFFN